MASTVRVSQDRPLAHVHVLAVGGFGKAFAARLASLRPGVSVAEAAAETAEPLLQADVLVLAAWRPAPALEDLLDETSFAHGVPWMRVVQDAAFLSLGPVVVPGLSACHGCCRRRLRQHAIDGDLLHATEEYYRVHPDDGPAGFLPPAASFAAAVVADSLEHLATTPAAEAGQLRRVNLLTWESHRSRVVGIHACTRCGRGRDERARGVERLARWGRLS